jgi:hypothetical protein
MIEAHPLDWPIGYKRTNRRSYSQFKQTMERAQQFLREEIKRLGATGLIISSNVPVRQDGGLYADWMKRKIEDPGVAIFFRYRDKEITMCCDQYERVWENVYSLGKTIEAIRAIERYGASEFMDRAFTGFTALPPINTPARRDIWQVLGLTSRPADFEVVKSSYRQLVKQHHPDAPGGSKESFQELQAAYEEAYKTFN